MYWAPGASHGPHHIFPAWADKYKGKFNAGWDVLRETVFANEKALAHPGCGSPPPQPPC